MILHSGVMFKNRFGGNTTTTLCGRMNAKTPDGMNIADRPEDVTCKFCLKKLRAAIARAEGRS